MRKLILFNMMSLDGFFEGPQASLDWHHVDEEFNTFAVEQLESAGGLVFGRVTYDLMADYWPSQAAMESDPEVAKLMNTIPKIVFSHSLDKAEWNNTRLVKTNPVDELSRLKNEPGEDLYIFGSAELAGDLIQHGIIDEFRVMVNPIILGGGKRLFGPLLMPQYLALEKTRMFLNGNVLLYYQLKELTDENNLGEKDSSG